MIYNVSGVTELWETLPVVEIAQRQQHELSGVGMESLQVLCDLCQVKYWEDAGLEQVVDFNRAFRIADQTASYHEALTKVSDWGTLKLNVTPEEPGSIVICPQPLRQGLGIPNEIWKHVIRFLRTYNQRVFLLSSAEHECSRWGFYENELVVGEQHIVRMCQVLAGAELIVGVPNVQMWLASAFTNKSIVLHPEDKQIRSGGLSRWYPYTKRHGRAVIHHDPESMKTPVLLGGIRKLLPILEHELSISNR